MDDSSTSNNVQTSQGDSQVSDSIFSDDSPEMRQELKATIAQSAPQNISKANPELQKYFEFLNKIMDVLGFDDAKKQETNQQFYFGIEAIAFQRLIELLDEPTRNKFNNLIQNTDPNSVDPETAKQLQAEFKSKIDNEKVFKSYFAAITAMVDLTVTDLNNQANEEQKQLIHRILLEQQDQIEKDTINVVPKAAISKS